MTQGSPLPARTLNRRQALVRAASGALASSVALPMWAHAQGTSNAPMRIVVGYPPGGGADRAARLVGERMQRLLGKPVIVENRPGAGGRLAAQQLASSPPSPDQTTLMIGNPVIMSVAPLLYKDLKYDPQKDFVPVGFINDYDFGVAVGNALPVREVSHMLAWMRANPEKAFIAVAATGSLPHFFTLMLSYMSQVKIEVVGYRGQAPLMTDLLGGQIPIAVDGLDALLPQHKAGKIRLLATSGPRRSPFAPNVPTFKEQGLPLVATGWNILYATANTPKATVEQLSKSLFQIMSDKDTREVFLAANITPMAMTQAQTIAAYQAFNAQWSPIIKRSGFKPDA